jgi:hypothetical protein
MNSSTSSNSQGAGTGVPKQGQFRPSAAPKAPRINANDVLQLLHGELKEAISKMEASATKAEETAQRNERSASRVKDYVNSLPPEVKTTHVFAPQDQKVIDQMRSTLASLPGQIDESVKSAIDKAYDAAYDAGNRGAKSVEYTLENYAGKFKANLKAAIIGWCLSVALAVVVGFMWYNWPSSEKNSLTSDERAELEKLRHDNAWLWKFAEDNPKTFKAWREKQPK